MAVLVHAMTQFYPTVKLNVGEPNPTKVLLMINRSIASGALWIAVRGREIVGSLAMTPMENWWSDTKMLVEMWLWVNEDARSFWLVRKFIKSAQQAAHELGLPMQLSIVNSEDVERKRRLYVKLGLRDVGGVFLGG